MLAQIVLYDGFDPLDALLPYEVLSAGGILSGGKAEAELVSAEGPREVRSGFKSIKLQATADLDPTRADVIVVPGTVLKVLAAPFLDSPDDGARRLVHLALTPEHLGGQYFVNDRLSNGSPPLNDRGLGDQLWQLAQSLTSTSAA
jgi:hypothetical protein